MHIYEHRAYLSCLDHLIADFPDWELLDGKTLLLSGASGMIGSLMIDAIMRRNALNRSIKVIALGRDVSLAKERFAYCWKDSNFLFYQQDVCEPIRDLPEPPDLVIHGASTTHPLDYAAQPVSTILTNVLGTKNMLDTVKDRQGNRFVLLSSVEIYGENRGDTERFSEAYCGYLDCNTLRAGYPEGKRVSEALCQAYCKQYGADAVILRLPRSYGPTMRMSDSKAIAQFIKKGLAQEDIVLKSAGTQLYSYCHAADAVSGILWACTRGTCGQAYNLGDARSDITLRELSEIIAAYAGTRVVFDLPDEVERQGFSTATKALVDARRLMQLGWHARYDITGGLTETLGILSELQRVNGTGDVI